MCIPPKPYADRVRVSHRNYSSSCSDSDIMLQYDNIRIIQCHIRAYIVSIQLYSTDSNNIVNRWCVIYQNPIRACRLIYSFVLTYVLSYAAQHTDLHMLTNVCWLIYADSNADSHADLCWFLCYLTCWLICWLISWLMCWFMLTDVLPYMLPRAD
jgi:hypothetical protein